MAVTAWLLTPQFEELVVPADVQDIIDQFSLNIVALAGWSEPVGNTFRMPPDPAGRFLELAFVRGSATRLLCTMTDDQGRSTSQRAFDLVPGATISFFFSARYLYIIQFTNTDHMWASMLSLFPESETAHNRYCIFSAIRSAAGALDGQSTTQRWRTLNNVPAYEDRDNAAIFPGSASGGIDSLPRHISGARRGFPIVTLGRDTGGGEFGFRGRIYNAVYLSADDITVGGEIPLPVGGGLTGIFVATNIPSINTLRYLVRKT